MKRIADYQSPEVRSVIEKIDESTKSVEEKIEAIFYYVRDSIEFGFLPKIDDYSASDIIKAKTGQCNNKSAVFLALCKAAGIEAKIHFSGIRKEIQKGLFTGIAYRFMPPEISHSWVDVKINGQWKRFDAYINDLNFYNSGKSELKRKNWKTGYSISCESGSSSSDFDLSENAFVQMDAITEDLSSYDDPSEFYRSKEYRNRPNLLKRIIYLLSLRSINGRVKSLRKDSIQCA